MNIINCVAGSQKIQKLLEDINNIKEKTLSDNFLILTLNQNKKNQITSAIKKRNIPVFIFNEFANSLLKKCPANINSSVISDFLAVTIINSLEKKEFIKNKNLINLTKSNSFSRELYNLISMLKTNRITYNSLIDICEKTDISEEDKIRFKLILNVYKEYNEFLNHNNLYDYRDVILNCIDFLNNNDVLRKTLNQKYKYIFVESAENLTSIQLELLKLFTNEENIFLYGDINAKINSFMGANVFNKETYDIKKSYQNEDILKRALYMVNEEYSDFDISQVIKYQNFNTIDEEISFIAKDILEEKEKKGLKFSDFAILLRHNSPKQSVADLLTCFDIPVSGKLYSNEYQNFKYEFTNILNICNLLKKINLTCFDKIGFQNIVFTSLIDLKNYAEEINSLLKNFLANSLNNKYLLEQIETSREKANNLFITTTIYENLEIFNEKDQKAIIKILENFEFFYKHYLKNEYIQIIMKITDIINSKDTIYKHFLAQFIKNIKEFLDIKIYKLKEDINFQDILDLMEITLEENSSERDEVNLITIFKSQGLKFEKVYIPLLTENYFPRKLKNTFFITKEANNKLSKEIKKMYPEFNKIIISGKEELIDEKKLLYVAMTRAKQNLFISTHKYENKKQTVPSLFFEQLSFIDKSNLIENNKTENKLQTIKKENIVANLIRKDEPVLNRNDEIVLSASGITDFIKCPRKFYYGRLLKLQGETSFADSYGTLVHSIFELLLSQRYIKDFSKELLLNLGLTLFNSENDEQKVLKFGFKQDDIDKIKTTSLLNLEEMKKNFKEAVNNLENSGFFTKKPIFADCEKNFKFKIPQLPNITFTGFIDAIIQYDDGYKLIDYKTGKTKDNLSTKIIPKLIKNYFDKNEPVKEQEINKNIKNFEYQIPLYYFACQNTSELEKYKELKQIGYQYVHTDKLSDGLDADFIDANIIYENQEQIIKNLKTLVIDKMYDKIEFETNYDEYSCRNCSFACICENMGDNEENND